MNYYYNILIYAICHQYFIHYSYDEYCLKMTLSIINYNSCYTFIIYPPPQSKYPRSAIDHAYYTGHSDFLFNGYTI